VFKAEEAVPKLEWDFRPYVDAHGVSPEPSGTALFAFQQNYNNTLQAYRRNAVAKAAVRDREEKNLGPEEIQAEIDRWAAMTWESAIEESARLMDEALGADAADELNTRVATLVAELTGDCPNVEQIMALPGRVRSVYFGWFVGQVSDPEALTAGTR
jgi:hypothetical protein